MLTAADFDWSIISQIDWVICVFETKPVFFSFGIYRISISSDSRMNKFPKCILCINILSEQIMWITLIYFWQNSAKFFFYLLQTFIAKLLQDSQNFEFLRSTFSWKKNWFFCLFIVFVLIMHSIIYFLHHVNGARIMNA